VPGGGDAPVVSALHGIGPDLRAQIEEWRERWDVPRHVYLTVGDNRLLLDLEDDTQLDELKAEVRRLPPGGQLLLQEALPSPADAWVPGPSGHHLAELVVPLVRQRHEQPHRASPRPVVQFTAADRFRAPGSDWLFAKLYGPADLEDDLLTGPVAELCACAAVAEWFFVRYADPHRHLRLRWHGSPEVLVGQLTPQLFAWAGELLADGRITKFGFDTYERELERFGGPDGTEAAESGFAADSRAVVDLLRLHRRGVIDLDLTTLAVVSVDELLSGLGLSPSQRQAWSRDHTGANAPGGDEYRAAKGLLRRLLGDPDRLRDEPGGDAVAQVLATRHAALVGVRRRLDDLAGAGRLSQPIDALLGSFVHLHCNRLLGGELAAEALTLGLLARTRYGLERTNRT
jgi:thiopeptide-type bacteriocin biosynthesis protein